MWRERDSDIDCGLRRKHPNPLCKVAANKEDVPTAASRGRKNALGEVAAGRRCRAAGGGEAHTQTGRFAKDSEGLGVRSTGSDGRETVDRGAEWGDRDAGTQTSARETHAKRQGRNIHHLRVSNQGSQRRIMRGR